MNLNIIKNGELSTVLKNCFKTNNLQLKKQTVKASMFNTAELNSDVRQWTLFI